MTHSQLLDALGFTGAPRCNFLLFPMGGYLAPLGGLRLSFVEVHVCVHCDLAFEVAAEGDLRYRGSYPFTPNCRRRRRHQ